jgi:Tfp pilus assembly protein PilF
MLTILSDPPESNVLLNGEARGTTNAEGRLVVEKLGLGHYSVEVRKEGFNPIVRGFQAGADSPTLVFKLEPVFEDINKEFDALIQAGKLSGPETPNALELVDRLAKKYPERPEIARMRGVLSARFSESISPVIDKTVNGWRNVTRDELVGAESSAANAESLKKDDNRVQSQLAYLHALLAYRDWQANGQSVSTGGNGGSDAAPAGERLTAARVEMEKAVALDDSWAPAWYQAGRIRLSAGDLSGAETAFNTVARLEPKWANAKAGLGATFVAWAKYKEAIEAYRKALEIDRNYAAAHAGLGHARLSRGEKDGLKDLKKAMELDPASGLPHLYQGMYYSKSKKKDELARASEELKLAIQKNTDNLEFSNRTAEQLLAELQKPRK